MSLFDRLGRKQSKNSSFEQKPEKEFLQVNTDMSPYHNEYDIEMILGSNRKVHNWYHKGLLRKRIVASYWSRDCHYDNKKYETAKFLGRKISKPELAVNFMSRFYDVLYAEAKAEEKEHYRKYKEIRKGYLDKIKDINCVRIGYGDKKDFENGIITITESKGYSGRIYPKFGIRFKKVDCRLVYMEEDSGWYTIRNGLVKELQALGDSVQALIDDLNNKLGVPINSIYYFFTNGNKSIERLGTGTYYLGVACADKDIGAIGFTSLDEYVVAFIEDIY